jgi:hypothetical protein
MVRNATNDSVSVNPNFNECGVGSALAYFREHVVCRALRDQRVDAKPFVAARGVNAPVGAE